MAAVQAGIAAGFTFSAAAVAFYMMTGLVPLLVACLLIYGLVADAGDVYALIDRLAGVLPPESLNLVQSVVFEVVSKKPGGTALAVGITISLWSGSKATEGLILGLRRAYEVPGEVRRGFVRLKLAAIGLALVGIVGVAVLAVLLVVLPLAVNFLGLEGVWNTLGGYFRWPLLVLVTFLGLCVIYRLGLGHRGRARGSVIPGAVLGAVLSTGCSALFTWYATGMGDFGRSYGSLAAVILLLLWCYLNAVVVLLGGHFNALAREEPEA